MYKFTVNRSFFCSLLNCFTYKSYAPQTINSWGTLYFSICSGANMSSIHNLIVDVRDNLLPHPVLRMCYCLPSADPSRTYILDTYLPLIRLFLGKNTHPFDKCADWYKPSAKQLYTRHQISYSTFIDLQAQMFLHPNLSEYSATIISPSEGPYDGSWEADKMVLNITNVTTQPSFDTGVYSTLKDAFITPASVAVDAIRDWDILLHIHKYIMFDKIFISRDNATSNYKYVICDGSLEINLHVIDNSEKATYD